MGGGEAVVAMRKGTFAAKTGRPDAYCLLLNPSLVCSLFVSCLFLSYFPNEKI